MSVDDVPMGEPAQLWAEQWAVQAAVKAETIRGQMRAAQADQAHTPRRREAETTIRRLLDVASEATCRRGRRQRRGPLDRWRGASIERAYQSLHAAEIFLVDLLSPEDVEALVPKVQARAAALLDPADPRRRQIDELSAMPPGPGKRAAVQSAMAVSYAASDQLHVRVRDFRNILAVSAVLIAVLMGLLTIVVMRFPAAMPLCFAPSSTGPQQAMGVEQVCPSGDGQLPSSGDVIIVVGLGLLGGALAAAFAIRNLRGTSTPYGIPIALAALKVPSGALAAVAGMLLLGGNFVPGLSELDSQRQILAYALLLGFAQQLATRLIDSRAQSLLDSVPSKDPDGKPLMQPVAPRPAVVLRVLEPIHPTGSGALPADPDGAAPVGAASAGAGQPTQAGP